MLRVLLIIVMPLLPVSVRAAHPLVTDDAGTQGAGRAAVELGGGLERARSGAVVEDAGTAAAVLSLGAWDTADLVLALPAAWSRLRAGGAVLDEQAGTADATLELKWRFFERAGFALAIKPALTLPTGDPRRGLGGGSVGLGVTLIATRALGPFALHANGAFFHDDHALAQDRTSRRHETWCGSAAVAAQVAARVQLVANLGVERAEARGAAAWPAFALVGAIYSVTDRLALDVGVRRALGAADTGVGILAGAAYRY